MGAGHSSERNSVRSEVTPQLISSMEKCVQEGRYHDLRRKAERFTKAQRRHLFAVHLPTSIHLAISQKNAEILQFLVQHCDVPLEVRDADGLTPLYSALLSHWSTGAWILLRGGADIHNADRGPNRFGRAFKPVLHLAVRTGSQELVQELVRRGADINVKDSKGRNWFTTSAYRKPPLMLTNFMWQKTFESRLEAAEGRPALDSIAVFEFFVALYVLNNIPLAVSIINRSHCCEQTQMWQLLGAWFALNDDDERALSCWRKETSEPCWLHDLNTEKETAPKSVFADILDVNVHQLLSTVHISEETKTAIRIRSLLIIERHISNMDLDVATSAVVLVARSFLNEDKPASAIYVLSRFTASQVLQLEDIMHIIESLKKVLDALMVSSNLSCSVLLEFMATASRCLWLLKSTGSFGMERSSKTLHDVSTKPNHHCELCENVKSLCQAYLDVMDTFSEMDVPATPEQLQCFHGHTKTFVSCFPWHFAQNFSHLPGSSAIPLCNPSVIKTLVVCSAEVKGQVRQENCPLHLAADARGNTPLHIFAKRLSQEDLLDNGVLECFLKHGADLCARNRRGRSVRDILVKRGILSAGVLLPSLQCVAAAAFMRDPQLRRKVDQCGVAAVKHFLLDHSDC